MAQHLHIVLKLLKIYQLIYGGAAMIEKRKHKRVKMENRLAYISFDKHGRPLDKGMGKTLNISQGGLLMKTKAPIEAKYIGLSTFDIINEFTKIKGKVVYCRKKAPEIFHIGIRFKETNEKIQETIVDMIKVFNRNKRIHNKIVTSQKIRATNLYIKKKVMQKILAKA